MLTFFENTRLCTMVANAPDNPYGLIDDGAIVVEHDRIQALGRRTDLNALYAQDKTMQRIDLQGALLTPGLIDCHTHLVYAGNRANEFEQRLNGVSYADIANAGGGIMSTVRATRAASETTLLHLAQQRLQAFLREGVTTIEIKSGYGLDADSESKMLRVARQLGEQADVHVSATLLGAHALPPEFSGRSDDYIDYLCTRVLPQMHQDGLVDAVDVFCEHIGFSLSQSEKMLRAARALNVPVKIHADQLSDQKGAVMAAELGALSVDHIEYLADEDVPVLARQGTVAVILPGAFYYLREQKLPPFAALRKHGVPMAIASDHNPGTSPCQSLLLMLNMACTLFRFTPLEALQGVTVHAAQALGLSTCKGRLAVGMDADFALYAIAHPAELSYRFGANPCIGRVYNGRFFSHKDSPDQG